MNWRSGSGVALLIAIGSSALAQEPSQHALPQLLPGVRLEAGGQVIDDQRIGHFVPTVMDFNGDGKKDLIAGLFAGDPGNVWLYLNEGTDAEVKLAKGTPLEAEGQPIKLTGG